MAILDITADDLACLNDEQLRALVARLCEAEVGNRGYSTSSVTWGGHQDAPDGGIDVRVALPGNARTDGYVPRVATGFQVKKQKLPPGVIRKEMCPKGTVRPCIQDLALQRGAYIIVSSAESTTDAELQCRLAAMHDAAKGMRNAADLALDFYDRTRLASWVRAHPGLIPWVRETIGKGIPGWQSYGCWAYAPEPAAAEYLLDDHIRIHCGKKETTAGLSALQGIQQIRDHLREPQKIVRLVGLSGVGKTRLVQVLFDERVGEHCLDRSLAIYTNTADSPDPLPMGLASDLIAAGMRAILVIDNCPPDLHQRLSELCRGQRSKISLVTVEFDIREDEPEGTDVFVLEPTSHELVERLVRQRFPDVSRVNAQTIAEFSGGNARIAITLASTVEKSDTLAGLSDEQLLQRLVWQRHPQDDQLFRIAEACSLVYSFQGEDVSNADDTELTRLGRIIEASPQRLYRGVAELQRRGLVQRRGVWRAVLPHAIADRLAARALENVPIPVIEQHLVNGAPARLLRSFSRRLGYLHASAAALAIVRKWLTPGGLLGNVTSLSDLGRAMFSYVAPAAPEDALAALESAEYAPDAGRASEACRQHLHTILSLAYEPALFERAAELLVDVAAKDGADGRSQATSMFKSLFQLYLSGTRSTIEQRLVVIQRLLASTDAIRRRLGALALESALNAGIFQAATHDFAFGSRSRDYGYWPRSTDEIKHWFCSALRLAQEVACSESLTAEYARVALAKELRWLWLRAGIPEEIASVCRAISGIRFWPEGWIAVRQTLRLDGSHLKPGSHAHLKAIEAQLRPTNIVEQARSIIASAPDYGTEIIESGESLPDDIAARMTLMGEMAREVGREIAGNEPGLAELLPDLLSTDGDLLPFGQGLAEGAASAEALWNRLVTGFGGIEEERRRSTVLAGYLCQVYATNPKLANELLDKAVGDRVLAGWYPILQCAVGVDSEGVSRLKRSLILGTTPASTYLQLKWGRATDPISSTELREILRMIAEMPSGHEVAIEVLHMRLFSDQEKHGATAPELIEVGRDLVRRCPFDRSWERLDYTLGEIARTCFKWPEGVVAVKQVCRNLKDAIVEFRTFAPAFRRLLEGLLSAQPAAALDGLCGGGEDDLANGMRILQGAMNRADVIAAIPEDELVQWCDEDPAARYPAFGGVVAFSERSPETGKKCWTALALRMLRNAPDPGAVLKQFVLRFMSEGGWGDSQIVAGRENAQLLDQLGEFDGLEAALAEEKVRVQEMIRAEEELQAGFHTQRYEQFE